MSLVDQIQNLASRIATEFNTVRTEISQSGGGGGSGVAKQLTGLILPQANWELQNGLWEIVLPNSEVNLNQIPQVIPVNPSYNVAKAAEILPASECVEIASALSQGLIGAWQFNEISGLTALDSIGNNDGTNTGTLINQTGKLGKAYQFNGVDAIVEVPGSEALIPGNNWSLNVWVYPTSTNTEAILSLFGGSGYSSSMRLTKRSDAFRFEWGSSSGNTRMEIPAVPHNKWSMLTMTWDGNTISAYVDGVLEASTPTTFVLATYPDSYPMKIGYANGMSYFTGLIDDVYYYNETLDLSRIQQLYNSGQGIAYPDWETGSVTGVKVYSVNQPTANIEIILNLFPKA